MKFVSATRWALAVLILAALAWQFWRNDLSFVGSLRQPSTMLIAIAFILAIVSYFAFVDAWAALRGRGETWRDVGGIWFASLLARYVPGAIWQSAVRIAGAHAAGEPKQLALLQYVAEQLLACFSAATLALAVIGIMRLEIERSVVLGLSLIVVGSSGIVYAARRRGITVGWTMRAVTATLLGHIAMALGFAAFVMSWTHVDLRIGATSMAAFLVAGVAGVLAVFVPAGLGVREAVLSLLLAPQLGDAFAIAVAFASRVWLLLSELGAFGAWTILARIRK